VQALLATRETLNVRESGMPADTAPLDGSVLMSERFNFSSTKNGPSVSAAVRTQLAPVVVVPVGTAVDDEVSVAPAAPAAQAIRTDWDTTTLAAPFAANPSRSRRLRRARVGDADRLSRNLLDITNLKARVIMTPSHY
jgi:hypothetical protein